MLGFRWPGIHDAKPVHPGRNALIGGRLALLRPRLGAPQAIVGEAVRQVAQADLRSVFRDLPQSHDTAATILCMNSTPGNILPMARTFP